jgi:hypothetical protein
MNDFRERRGPFQRPSIYDTAAFILEGFPVEGGNRVKLQVNTYAPTETVIWFWDNADSSAIIPWAILHSLNLEGEFFHGPDGRPTKTFAFPSGEAELYAFITMFLERLRNYVAGAGAI